MKRKSVLCMCLVSAFWACSCADTVVENDVQTGSCLHDQYLCEGQVLKHCDGGTWVTARTCSEKQTCSETSKACVDTQVEDDMCKSGDTGCRDEHVMLSCEQGKWVEKPCNTDSVCSVSQKSCVKLINEDVACAEGANLCLDNSLVRCQNGVWTIRKKCETGSVCNDKLAACVFGDEKCAENEYSCVGNKLYLCKNGKQTEQNECGAGESCSAFMKGCVKTGDNKPYQCTDGARQCNPVTNVVEKCDSGAWTVDTSCADGMICSNETLTCVPKNNETVENGDCEAGAYQCTGNTLEVCMSGKWATSRKCDPAMTKCDDDNKKCTSITECESGDVQCSADGLKVKKCVNGKWDKETACPDYQVCKVETKGCDNKYLCDGSYICEGNKLLHCTPDEGFFRSQLCTSDQVCDDKAGSCRSKSAPICSSDKAECDEFGLRVKVCSADHMKEELNDCPANQECSGGICLNSMKPPVWANIQHIDENSETPGSFLLGYGRIGLPDGVSVDDITASMYCGKVTDPVSVWAHQDRTFLNSSCSDCKSGEYEFISPGANAAQDSDGCVFVYKFGAKRYIGTPSAEYKLMDKDTKVTKDEIIGIKVKSPVGVSVSWCQFTHAGAVPDSSSASKYMLDGYAQVYPGGLNGGQIQAKMTCKDGADDIEIIGYQNVFCSFDICGNNFEYMFNGKEIKNLDKAVCKVTMTINGIAYLCPIDNNSQVIMDTRGEFKPGYSLNVEIDHD